MVGIRGDFNDKNTRPVVSAQMAVLGNLDLDSQSLAADEIVPLCDCQLDWRSNRTARLPSEDLQ